MKNADFDRQFRYRPLFLGPKSGMCVRNEAIG